MPSHIEPYGRTSDGQEVHRITLHGDISVQALTFGARIARIEAADRAGQMANVALGLNSLQEYADTPGHFGAIAGRYAGRIAGASFELDGATYNLPKNNGENSIHGGPQGFHKRVWTIEAAEEGAVVLSYLSHDGEEGFPGTLLTRLSYSVSGHTLQLRYEATTDQPTILNLTNHSYFNLGGEGSGDVFDHVLQIDASRYLEVNADNIPTGAIRPVADSPFDFRAPRMVGERVRVAHPQVLIAQGYDQCWVLDGAGMRRVAAVRHPPSGRRLEVWTDEPGAQVYTANKLTASVYGPAGRVYRSGDGLTFETQHFPDSPHHPDFPSTVLRPGEAFRSATDFVFSAD